MECSGVNVSQILSNHSIVTVKMEEKQLKPWGVLMDKQNHPTFPYRPPNLLVLKKNKKKSSPAFANLWLLLVLQLTNITVRHEVRTNKLSLTDRIYTSICISFIVEDTSYCKKRKNTV